MVAAGRAPRLERGVAREGNKGLRRGGCLIGSRKYWISKINSSQATLNNCATMNTRPSNVCIITLQTCKCRSIDRSIDLVIECTAALIVVIKLNWINLSASGPLLQPSTYKRFIASAIIFALSVISVLSNPPNPCLAIKEESV
jgi:hypothetical protein